MMVADELDARLADVDTPLSQVLAYEQRVASVQTDFRTGVGSSAGTRCGSAARR